ncbi:hypothetical protein ACHAWO_000198 [Cyclotella atomus]|uniref:Uncharacterized protein n=1 Tax=Cyclotella atomus TaxID=382360 RepID=A0ABD3MNA8_9STRA
METNSSQNNNPDESSAMPPNIAPSAASIASAAPAEASSSSHTRQPSLDMESLLRQWGGASVETNEIIDESISPFNNSMAVLPSVVVAAAPLAMPTDDNIEGGLPPPFLGRSHSTTPNENHHTDGTADTLHRRIASTGGDRLLTLPSIPFSTNNNPTPNPAPSGEELHAAARITDWSLVLTLSKSPKSSILAKYRGPDGWTALHHACSRRCPHPDVIEALLKAHPHALVQVDDRGWTPLHHASRFKAPKEVVRLLLRCYTDLGERCAKIRCSQGRSALYYAMRYEAPLGVVELLLQADPMAVLDEDRDGLCPLSLVWDGYANGFGGKRDLKALLRKFEGEHEHTHQQQNENFQQGEELAMAEKRVKEAILVRDTPALRELQSKWRIVNNLLRAYFHFPVQTLDSAIQDTSHGGKKWRILHAVSAIKCHHTLFLLARALHPEQAGEVDQNDLLAHESNSRKPQSPEETTLSNRTALHFAAMSPLSGKDGRNVIKTLISLNPDAPRQTDGYGSLPLHLMAENEHKIHWVHDGFRDVYDAYQEASSCRDGLGRTPLHCATGCSRRYSNTAHHSGSHEEGAAAVSQQQQQQQLPPNAPPRDFNLAARNAASVILNLVIVNQAAASIADNTGRLPLHYIAEHGEEWSNDATSILAAHPAAARTRAGSVAYNQLPLHMAASNPDAHPSLIMNIVNSNPRAASLVDGSGRLPLHMACDSGRTTWDRGIESIYTAYHAAISVAEESPRAWTVLHTAAASHSAGQDLIENVLSLNPGAASMPDGEGRYPLHLACAAGRHWEGGGLRILFEADPSVALMEDGNGFLPFHIVAMKKPCLTDNRSRDGGIEDEDGDEGVATNEEEDLASMEVLFNLLIAQPSTVQLR